MEVLLYTKEQDVSCPECRREVTDAEREALRVNPLLKQLLEAHAVMVQNRTLMKRELKEVHERPIFTCSWHGPGIVVRSHRDLTGLRVACSS